MSKENKIEETSPVLGVNDMVTILLKNDYVGNMFKTSELNARYFSNDFTTRNNNTRGKILTLIEAIIVDKEQKKAVKDVIHEIFNNAENEMYQDFYLRDIKISVEKTIEIK